MAGSNTEYMRGLDRWADQARGFLFSAAGNDVIGQDISGQPVLTKLLKQYQAGQSAAWHINRDELDATVGRIRTGYSKVITTIQSNRRFKTLPIFVHGYDYPFPYPTDDNDNRNPIYAAQDEYLGKPFKDLGFPADLLRRDIVKIMIDALYTLMYELSAQYSHVHVVDARGSMPTLDLWADEIHGTKDGFAAVANRFRAVIANTITPQ
ncbi:MAG: hypothetical protein OXI87_17525 [Albidovulum sp.]|nr:hypothetical protein [Albidovulum sp.]